VTLERGSDGSYLAWVHELPGCFARGATRDAAISNAAAAATRFREWLAQMGEATDQPEFELAVVDEVESAIEADEDTEVLLEPDRAALSTDEWRRIERWLAHSRAALLDDLAASTDERLAQPVHGRDRSVRDTLIHIAFVELMYAAWTFDLGSREGLAQFLGWTRAVASDRMRSLAEREDASLTYAEWAGAPGPEPWTARKAARRLIWHELLHLPEVAAAAPTPGTGP
jgi:predicted RNase H-like HicB family nuclease